MDNPFQSPTTDVPTEKGGSTSSPAPLALRLAILAFCSVQFLVLLWNRGAIWDAMRAGEISVFGAAGGFLFAFLLMLAGALLFFAQRSARWLLLACLPYQLYALATAPERGTQVLCLLSLVCLIGCLVYSWRLRQAM